MNKKKRGKVVYNDTYQGEIIQRMFDNNDKKMLEFHENYSNHKKTNGGGYIQPASKRDLDIYNQFCKGVTHSEIEQMTGLSYARIQSAIVRSVYSLNAVS